MNKMLFKYGFSVITLFAMSFAFGQADCNIAEYGCTLDDFTTNSSGGGAVADIPSGSNISNPSSNPGSAGNSGCLLAGELNPTWIIFTISTPGYFEFTLGQAGANGYFDWSMWPYYEAGDPNSIAGGDACAEIQGNLLPPVACNWNGSSAGYAGMVQQGNLPAGANQSNFENSFWAEPGDQFVLMFSNYSGLVGTTVPIYTGTDIPGNAGNANTADVTCDPSSVGTTVCLGEVATITVNPNGIIGATYTFLNNQSDLVDPTQTGPTFDLLPSDTTTYQIEVSNGIISNIVEVTINVVPPPAPNAGSDFVVCFGSQGQLNGSISNASNSASWSFVGPSGTPAPPNVIFTPNNTQLNASIQANYSGTYTLILTESNGVCPDETDDVEVIFDVADISTVGTNPICAGANDGIIEILSSNAVDYSFDGGLTWQAANTSTGFTVGTHTVCSRTALGCVSCEDVTLQDGPGVSITVSNDTIICQNGAATMVANAVGGSTFSYNWSTISSTAATQNVNPLASTSYSVQAVNEFGCASNTLNISVTVLPPLTGTVSPDQSVCPGFSTLLSVEAGGGNGGPYAYQWLNGSGNTVGNNPTYLATPNQTTTYTVVMTDGCESTPYTLPVTVNVYPLPNVQFSSDVPARCEPASFFFSNDTDPTSVSNYYWYFSNGESFANMTDFEVSFENAGSYDVQLIVESPDGCIDSLTQYGMITVHPTPTANFTFSPTPITVLNTDVFFQNYSVGAVAYNWYFEQGSPGASSLQNPTTSLPEGEAADYLAELVAISEFGCSDTVDAIISVVPEVIVYAPNAFTPDGDEFNQNWRVYISGISLENFYLEIYNRWGEILWESHNPEASWDGTYGGKLVEEGTYIWRMGAMDLYTDKKMVWTGHITVLY